MGRRKISIQPITDERNRKVKAGLFKKAHELAVLCQVDLAVIILGNNNSKFYEYSSVNVQDLLGDFQDQKFLHDTKTPGDYGDYELKSRVRGRGDISTSRASSNTHNRNASMNSVSLEDNEQSSDEEDDDDEDEEEEEEVKPALKRRKVTEAKAKSQPTQPKRQSQKSQKSQANQHQQVAPPHPDQPQNLLPPPNLTALQTQYQQQQQQQQKHLQLLQQQQQHQQHQQQMSYEGHQIGRPTYVLQGNIPNQQQQQQQPISHPQQGSFPTDPSVHPQYQYPIPQYQLPPQQSPYLAHQQVQSQARQGPQQTDSVSSNSSTPVIPSSMPVMNSNSPFTNSQRARSINNSINSRPQLRVEIPKDHKNSVGEGGGANNDNSKPSDSAITVTAIETSKNNSHSKDNDGENTPSSGSSKPDDSRPGLGILSNKSTPISATLPSGLFSLPPPQPNPQFQNNNFKPPLNINTGEQTPLTGGLPSRYVPDLFPSPSNFYSNEWNIPFGSGNTPYPNSAIQSGQMLPNINNGKIQKHSNLQNDGGGASGGGVHSPLQNTPLSNQTKKKEEEKNLQGKRIKFEEP